MRKISVIGFFGGNQNVSDGQGVKTKIVTEELEKAFGADNVKRVDTCNWKKNPLKLFSNIVRAVRNSENVMFLTAEGGLKIFPTLLLMANIDNRCKLHYYVVGGWLGRFLDQNKSSAKILKRLDAIYVELPAMLEDLNRRGFANIVFVNKFRRMNIADESITNQTPAEPFKLCYFSRVMKEKGVEECIESVKLANQRAGRVKFTLDIYGTVNSLYKDTFENAMKSFPDYIKYGGVVDFQHSTDVLKDYFAMLFPTFYPGEGYPNTVVDAYAAGLPVIATRWNYNEDIIRENEDGVFVDVGNVEQLADAMDHLTDDLEHYQTMRKNCLDRCRDYLPENAIRKVIEQMK